VWITGVTSVVVRVRVVLESCRSSSSSSSSNGTCGGDDWSDWCQGIAEDEKG